MSGYRMGLMIKLTREARGFTQERLTEGICSVKTLSRIENEKKNPNRKTYRLLMERLGREGERNYAEIDTDTFELLEIKKDLDKYLEIKLYKKARYIWYIMNDNLLGGSDINRQYLAERKAIIEYLDEYINTERYLEMLKKALLITIPFYDEIDKKRWPYSKAELRIIINIAYALERLNRIEDAINLISDVQSVLDMKYLSGDFAIQIKLTILNTKARYLSLLGQYDEAIKIYKNGIEYSRKMKCGIYLKDMLFGLQWNKCNIEKDGEQSQKRITETIDVSKYYNRNFFVFI